MILNVLMSKMVTDWFDGKEIATAMGILLTTWPLGLALALSTLGSVATDYSWRAAVLITAAYSALALGAFVLFYRNPAKPTAQAPQPSALTAPGENSAVAVRPWALPRGELALILT